MDELMPRPDPGFTARTQALVAAWEENLRRAEPLRPRIFSDYQLLSETHRQVMRWLSSAGCGLAERTELQALEQRVSSCLAFANLAAEQVASLRRLLFANRSRGCRSSVSLLEQELLASLAERASEA